jgi:hypothetical protein
MLLQDCDEALYADFDNTDTKTVDALAHALANSSTMSQQPLSAGSSAALNNPGLPSPTRNSNLCLRARLRYYTVLRK